MAEADLLLLAGRVLFGGVLAFMGLNHFLQSDAMTGYAQHKGLPAPALAVFGSGAALVLGGLAVVVGVLPVVGALVLGGLAVVVGVLPVVGALVLAAFLLVAAVTMHDFWAVPEDQQQDEMTGFLKNVALAGGALALAASATTGWAYSVGVTLF